MIPEEENVLYLALKPLLLLELNVEEILVCCIYLIYLTFQISLSVTLFLTWINFLYLRLGSIPIWPELKDIKLPECMKEKFPNCKTIIDCVEFKVEVPSSLYTHKMLYSDYRRHTIVKALVGIIPGGGFSFISSLYPGSISDKEITVKSGILNPSLWKSGEAIMVDRGFTIHDCVRELGIELIIPDFLNGREQLSESELVHTQQIANERIHVERMIQRLKCWHIFDQIFPMNMMGSLNQIVTVCALLCNFGEPIIAEEF